MAVFLALPKFLDGVQAGPSHGRNQRAAFGELENQLCNAYEVQRCPAIQGIISGHSRM